MNARPDIGSLVDRRRLVVCVGAGGVGKTSIAAAIALGGALRGRSAMVLTIDPARALARALGLDALRPGGERIGAGWMEAAGLRPTGTLDAGMLDQQHAWDAFIARHAPTEALRDRVLANPFYRQLSRSFAGSTEYMAIEELCRLDESGRYDLIVLDTPPAAHALDFFLAPQRIDRLLDRQVAERLARPYQAAGRDAWRAFGQAARFLARQLERAVGASTLRDISGFFVAVDAMIGDIQRRSRAARALLSGRDTAFVLVAGPGRLVLEQTGQLAGRMQEQGIPLGGIVLNRTHPLDAGLSAAAVAAVLAELGAAGVAPAAVDWLRRRHAEAVAIAAAEADAIAALTGALAPEVAFSAIAELDRDLHSLRDLGAVAAHLWA